MWRFRDRGLQNQDFCIFVFTGSRPIQTLIGRPKNHSKILPKRIFGGAKKWTPLFLGLFKASLNGMSRCHFRRPLSNGTHLGNLRRRQKTSQEPRHHQKLEARKRFQPQNYRLLHFIRKIYKKVKKRRPLSGIGHFLNFGKCKKILNSKKKWPFYVGGVIKTGKSTLFIKKTYIEGCFYKL